MRTRVINKAGAAIPIIIAIIVFAVMLMLVMPCRSYATKEHPIVVSLGDSYSSGEGVPPFYDQDKKRDTKNNKDWLAHRSTKSWSGKLRVPLEDGSDVILSDVKGGGEKADWFFVASSGAVTADLNGRQKKEVLYYNEQKKLERSGLELITERYWLPKQLEIFDKLEKDSVDYVTITIGGNDAHFVDILKDAALHLRCFTPNKMRDKFVEIWKEYEDHIKADLISSYKAIQAKAGKQAKILVAGYPILLDPDGEGILFEKGDARIIDANVHIFNNSIRMLVDELRLKEKMHIYFVSVEERFDGHEAYSDDPYINEVYLYAKDQDLDQTAIISSYSIHPNDKGTWAYARAVQQMIDYLQDDEYEEEVSLPIKSGAMDGKRRDIALVLDSSGSMDGDPMDELKLATMRFAETVLGTTAKTGLISFNGGAEIKQELTGSQALIWMAADELEAKGSTNMGLGLAQAEWVLKDSSADKKIIVLMSDGEPNVGMKKEEIIAYANQLKSKGYMIYTLGFFSGLSPGSRSEPQHLLEQIASEGCHYEVTDAAMMQYFFGDIGDQINGVKYNYIRIACPVDVSVTYNGETLSSADAEGRARTSFGTLTFEEAYNEDDENEEYDAEETVKILRLVEGPEYEIKISGTGTGEMDYTIGFVDDNGEYSDMRYFDSVPITPSTEITTVAKVSSRTRMSVDSNGDGSVDVVYEAGEGSHAEIVDNSFTVKMIMAIVLIVFALMLVMFGISQFRRNRQ